MKPVRNTRVILILAVFLFFLPLLGHGTDNRSFAIIGDTGIGASDVHYRTFLGKIKSEGIDLIVHTGDVIDKPGSKEEWGKFFDITGNKLTVLISPGNHDVRTAKSLKVYENLTGKNPYFTFTMGDTQMIILCTELPGEGSRITGKQLAWLSAELEKPFRYRFVFLHRPPFPAMYHMGTSLDRFEKDRDILHSLLVRHSVNMVVAGHEHLYNRATRDGIVYVISGGGGARLHAFTEEQGGFFHYIIAKRNKEGYVLRVYDFEGKVRDEFQIKMR
ncbi:metallophosphoesterase family protein [Syntrophorhabdus aromaticivorans]|uniref:metallophosphoesterase family protein n=1 Tax=Syntrophorhabdus aromaticivorans TaxID=328301 RepID=UPI00048EA02B|nr:metallophosphoesterase [Syntrophorhabdus aromaticivorans]